MKILIKTIIKNFMIINKKAEEILKMVIYLTTDIFLYLKINKINK